jgi:pimeloyl-ACP methyl ester carboxylesterase
MGTTISRRIFVNGLGAGLAATTGVLALAGPASAGSTQASKPIIVLVHGGYADATISWTEVVRQLQGRGYLVIAPANPLRSLPADAAYIASVLRSIDGPVVLVGHSYGGAVITNAATNAHNVKALVYVAAFMPDTGESISELLDKYPGSEIAAAAQLVPYPNPDGTDGTDVYLRADKLRQVFAADLPASTTKIMAATQRPFSAACNTDLTQAAAWRSIPSWGLIATDDKAIPPALQRFEYQRAGSQTVSVSSSHVAMISHPDLVTRLIVDADRSTRQAITAQR